MLKIRQDLCTGCGVCTRVCPTGALSLDGGTARIDQRRCMGCQVCAQACPNGAIRVQETPVSPIWDLRSRLARLQAEAQTLTQSLEAIEQRKGRQYG